MSSFPEKIVKFSCKNFLAMLHKLLNFLLKIGRFSGKNPQFFWKIVKFSYKNRYIFLHIFFKKSPNFSEKLSNVPVKTVRFFCKNRKFSCKNCQLLRGFWITITIDIISQLFSDSLFFCIFWIFLDNFENEREVFL